MARNTILKPIQREYPFDTNLLTFMFIIARNDRLLDLFLREIVFIRENPGMTEDQVRKELTYNTTGTA